MSKVDFPNTFQSPNSIIDDGVMALLNGNEFKCLVACQRCILGWEKHRVTRQDRISISQLVKMTGLSSPTVAKAMTLLDKVHLVKKQHDGKKTHHPDGTLWELNMGQLDDGIDLKKLQELRDKRLNATHDKMKKARDARPQNKNTEPLPNGITSHDSVMPLGTTGKCHYTPLPNGITTPNPRNPIKPIGEEKTSSPSVGEEGTDPPRTEDPVKKKEPTKQYQMMCTIGEVCQMDLKLNNGRIGKCAKALLAAEYTSEQVQRLYSGDGSWWYKNDWRGQKKNVPRPEQIGETIKLALKHNEKSGPTSNSGNIPSA